MEIEETKQISVDLITNSKAPDLSAFKGLSWNDEVGRKTRIAQDALTIPSKYRKGEWIKIIADKYNVDRSTVYRCIDKFKKAGSAGFSHTRSTKGKVVAWTDEAVEFWIGLFLKRAHRRISRKGLYKVLKKEAAKRGWKIGSYRNACYQIEERVSKPLIALQRGGARELDNSLPPILRNYNDLMPFEILVGDQHRFDFWVLDEQTGECFRPECYVWQDLATRNIYGGALAKKYDSHLIALSLNFGAKFFGLFRNIYTDNGKPELSHYIEGILEDVKGYFLSVQETIDIPVDFSNVDPEEIQCYSRFDSSGEHIRAVIKNAKSKMAEVFFSVFEGILRDQFRLPGYVKRLSDDNEIQEIDEEETRRLAKSGELVTWREFVVAFYEALAWYNNEKPHSGVLREWRWEPKPKQATPKDCLRMCIRDGWRPTILSDEAIDLLFLPRDPLPRTVQRGRIQFRNRLYEHKDLIELSGKKVDIRFNPLDPDWILIFHKNKYCCRAEPVEYSSMKNQTLAQKKIKEKARLRKVYVEQYERFTAGIPDLRQFSEVPALEKAAALIGKDKRKKVIENQEFYHIRSHEELSVEVAKLEQIAEKSQRKLRIDKDLPKRPSCFLTELDRYKWVVRFGLTGGELSSNDQVFKANFEAGMSEEQREYWETTRQYMEVGDQ